ncbi:MAG: hypothetical protein H6672_06100 [Anaerolineaceae bacterium]|nr:hypothetical protein [Anaerolineaceae bacterium]
MMYNDPDIKRHSPGNIILGVILITIGVVVLFVITVTLIDDKCYNDATTWLPVYPNATVTSVTFDYFRAWGLGETVMELSSPDDRITVNTWYANTMEEIGKQYSSRGLADTDVQIRNNPNGAGSLIILYSACANS